MNSKPKTIPEYIKDYPKETQKKLKEIYICIKKSAPKAEEAICYGIPTFILKKNLVHFGGFKNHIGFFPTPSAIKAFKKELALYVTSKGAIQFPLDKPLPIGLIKKITKYRVKEVTKQGVK